MTTVSRTQNRSLSLELPEATWRPITNWLRSFLDKDRRRPHQALPLTQLQAITDQARHHGARTKRPLQLTMPQDSWQTLASQISHWLDCPDILRPLAPDPPCEAFSSLLDIIEKAEADGP